MDKIYRIKARFETNRLVEGAAGHYTFTADFEGEPREHSISALDECINLRDW